MRDELALIAFLEGRIAMPFAWGRNQNDCISYGLGAVKAQTGVDLLAGSGLRWGSALGAARVLKSLGGLSDAVDSRLPRIGVAMARRGDVGMIMGDNGPLLVVIEGHRVSGPGLHGREFWHREAMTRAWSIEKVGE